MRPAARGTGAGLLRARVSEELDPLGESRSVSEGDRRAKTRRGLHKIPERREPKPLRTRQLRDPAPLHLHRAAGKEQKVFNKLE